MDRMTQKSQKELRMVQIVREICDNITNGQNGTKEPEKLRMVQMAREKCDNGTNAMVQIDRMVQKSQINVRIVRVVREKCTNDTNGQNDTKEPEKCENGANGKREM